MSNDFVAIESRPEDDSPLATAGWATFLGMSWTWCIGMFLPVLLIRDYGPLGWWVFAVPNVIGAAAMGFVLRDAAASRRIVEKHATACVAFSVVTLVFQWFFLVWMVGRFGESVPLMLPGLILPGLMLLLAICMGWVAHLNTRALWVVALLVFIVSLGLSVSVRTLPRIHHNSEFANSELCFLAPVCMFGFALCPYLDLTFHQARQATSPAAGRMTFFAGFCFFFLAAIMFTAFYAPILLGQDIQDSLDVLIVYFLIQIALKFALHGNVLLTLRPAHFANRRLALYMAVTAVLFVLIALIYRTDAIFLAGLTFGEVTYRVFMGFYGLIFPAYVWLYMIGNPRFGRALNLVYGATIALAAPLYFLGFIERRMIWLAPGLGIVLLAKLLAPRTRVSV